MSAAQQLQRQLSDEGRSLFAHANAAGGGSAEADDESAATMVVRVFDHEGTEHLLGELALSTTMRQVKQRLAELCAAGVASQQMYNANDGRSAGTDTRLGDDETVGDVRKYGSGMAGEGVLDGEASLSPQPGFDATVLFDGMNNEE